MPSNAKKRKAAKRKKGVESSSNNNSNSIPQGSTAESHGTVGSLLQTIQLNQAHVSLNCIPIFFELRS